MEFMIRLFIIVKGTAVLIVSDNKTAGEIVNIPYLWYIMYIYVRRG